MGDRVQRKLILLLIGLFACMVVVQHFTDPDIKKLNHAAKSASGGNSNELMVELPGQFLVASLTGCKEVIAGMLWVRADEFFHSGQFQAIVPIVRLVTWLDPHQIDVYTTGAWHLDYNFVDEAQMSDKRYIPASVALLKEGIRNNPDTWDLYFDLAWSHYNKKLQDYQSGLKYLKLATTKHGVDPNTGGLIDRPEFVDRMLAHQYEKTGRYREAIAEWGVSRANVEKMLKSNNPKKGVYVDQTSLDLCDRNLSLLYLRLAWRYGNMDYYKKGLDLAKRLSMRDKYNKEWFDATNGAEKDYQQRLASNNPPRDALKPLDAGFQPSWKRVKPRIIQISGKVNLAAASEYKDLASESFTHWYRDNENSKPDQRKGWRDGARVNWMLCDYDYKMPNLDTFDWKIDTDVMVVWDSIYVGGGSFSDKIDLSKNSEFYPFRAKKYKLTIWVTPQEPGCPDYIQDRVGWSGEAFTDKNYLDTKSKPGLRILKKEYIIDRKDLT